MKSRVQRAEQPRKQIESRTLVAERFELRAFAFWTTLAGLAFEHREDMQPDQIRTLLSEAGRRAQQISEQELIESEDYARVHRRWNEVDAALEAWVSRGAPSDDVAVVGAPISDARPLPSAEAANVFLFSAAAERQEWSA